MGDSGARDICGRFNRQGSFNPLGVVGLGLGLKKGLLFRRGFSRQIEKVEGKSRFSVCVLFCCGGENVREGRLWPVLVGSFRNPNFPRRNWDSLVAPGSGVIKINFPLGLSPLPLERHQPRRGPRGKRPGYGWVLSWKNRDWGPNCWSHRDWGGELSGLGNGSPGLSGLFGWKPLLAGIVVVADEFLFFGVHRNHRSPLGQTFFHDGIDVPELRIPIGMIVLLQGFGIALEGVVQGKEEAGHWGMGEGGASVGKARRRSPACSSKSLAKGTRGSPGFPP